MTLTSYKLTQRAPLISSALWALGVYKSPITITIWTLSFDKRALLPSRTKRQTRQKHPQNFAPYRAINRISPKQRPAKLGNKQLTSDHIWCHDAEPSTRLQRLPVWLPQLGRQRQRGWFRQSTGPRVVALILDTLHRLQLSRHNKQNQKRVCPTKRPVQNALRLVPETTKCWLLDGANPTRMKKIGAVVGHLCKNLYDAVARNCNLPPTRTTIDACVELWPRTSWSLVVLYFLGWWTNLRTKRRKLFWTVGWNIVNSVNAACTKQSTLFHENNSPSIPNKAPSGEYETKPQWMNGNGASFTTIDLALVLLYKIYINVDKLSSI